MTKLKLSEDQKLRNKIAKDVEIKFPIMIYGGIMTRGVQEETYKRPANIIEFKVVENILQIIRGKSEATHG